MPGTSPRPPLTVAVVGATGAVGRTMIQVLRERRFPIGELRLLASARSAGKHVTIDGEDHEIREATPDAFEIRTARSWFHALAASSIQTWRRVPSSSL